MASKAWTADEVETLKQMYSEAVPTKQMAETFGRSVNAVSRKLTDAGLRTPGQANRNGWRAKYESTAAKLTELTGEHKRLQRAHEQLEHQLQAARKKKLTIPLGGKRKKKTGDSFCRVMYGDTHGCMVDTEAFNAFVNDLEIIRPSEIIHGGDIIDCGGFLAQHHVLGYVADTEYSYADDLEAGNELLDRIAKALPPGCKQRMLEGNHEARIEKWIVDQTHNNKDARLLRKVFGPDIQLNLEARGIEFCSQGEFHDDIGNRATIRSGKSMVVHGASHAGNATQRHAQMFGCNVIHFHTHTARYVTQRTVAHGIFGGWCPGCLCKLQPRWQHSKPTQWSHGYHLQVVTSSGDFLGINVPIIDGKSYLAPLAESLAS